MKRKFGYFVYIAKSKFASWRTSYIPISRKDSGTKELTAIFPLRKKSSLRHYLCLFDQIKARRAEILVTDIKLHQIQPFQRF